MAATGIHAEEYWGDWSVLGDRVHVEGTKRGGRRRDVPLVIAPVRATIVRRTFENRLRRRSRALQVYDLRRTYANWMESAGIPRTRRRMYLGHGERDVTDLYERHEVAAFLVEDAKRLWTYLATAIPVEATAVRAYLSLDPSAPPPAAEPEGDVARPALKLEAS